MNQKLNITKEFLIEKTFEDTVSILNTIVSSKYDNSRYSTFGNVISADPPEYSLMTKWYSIGRTLFGEFVYTKIIVKILPFDNKSKISIKTKTNPVFYLYFFVFALFGVITILTLQNIIRIGLFLFLAIVMIVFDRWKKEDLIDRFERDIEIKIIK